MLNEIITYFSGTLGIAELVATAFSVACVYQLAHQKIINFLWGSIGVIIFGWIFYEYKLYSDMGLQLFYFLPIQIVSAWWWAKNSYKEKTGREIVPKEMPVIGISSVDRSIWIGFIAVTSTLLGFNMANLTDAALPYWDALTTMMSITAQYLMIKKVWESWVIWIAMDVIAINIYHLKGLEVTSGLYAMFLILASYGLTKWYKSFKMNAIEVE